MNLEFRKFLTTYGISHEEYESMEDNKKQELINKFNQEMKQQRTQGISKGMQDIGKGCQGIGCALILLPAVIFLLLMVFR